MRRAAKLTSYSLGVLLFFFGWAGAACADNEAFVSQQDVRTSAVQEQAARAPDAYAGIAQQDIRGRHGRAGWRHNFLRMNQDGARNEAALDQRGNGNFSNVRQFGRGLTATVTQDGNGNVAIVRQFGAGNTATVTQTGSNNFARVIQIGCNQTTNLVQDGDGRVDVVVQGSWRDLRRGANSCGQ